MGNVADLRNIDIGQIITAQRFGQSISETSGLECCSRSAVVDTYEKWINDIKTSNRRKGVDRLHATKEKRRRRLSRMLKKNWHKPWLTWQSSTMHVLAQVFRIHSTAGTVGYGTEQQTSQSWASVYQTSLLTTNIVGSGTSWLNYGINVRDCPGQLNHDFSYIKSMIVSEYGVFQRNSCYFIPQVTNRLVLAVLCFGGLFHKLRPIWT